MHVVRQCFVESATQMGINGSGRQLKAVEWQWQEVVNKKFVAIARKKELLEHYVDALPTAWTTIYQLAKLDADEFERLAC